MDCIYEGINTWTDYKSARTGKASYGLESERGRFLHPYLERGQILTIFTLELIKRVKNVLV